MPTRRSTQRLRCGSAERSITSRLSLNAGVLPLTSLQTRLYVDSLCLYHSSPRPDTVRRLDPSLLPLVNSPLFPHLLSPSLAASLQLPFWRLSSAKSPRHFFLSRPIKPRPPYHQSLCELDVSNAHAFSVPRPSPCKQKKLNRLVTRLLTPFDFDTRLRPAS